MCVNVRSLNNPHNFTKFESLIAGLDYQPHIIAVNETWDKPHATGQHMNLNGYVYIFNPRVASRGGGVGMYIKQSLIFTPYAELSIMHEKLFESLFVTIHFGGKRLICGTVYRPPRNDNLGLSGFFDSIKLVLGELSKTKSKCFLMGDLHHHRPVLIRFFLVSEGGRMHLIPSAIAPTPSLHLARSVASSTLNPIFFIFS